MKKETPVFKLAETPQKSAEIIQFPQHKIVRMPVEPDETEKLDKSKRKQADRIIHELTQDIIDELHIGYDVDVVAPDFQKDFSYSMECVRATIYRSFGLEHPFHDYMDTNVKVATKEEIAGMISNSATTISETV